MKGYCQEHFGHMACPDERCTHEGEAVTFRPRCHPNAGAVAKYHFDSGAVILYCAACDQVVIGFQVAEEIMTSKKHVLAHLKRRLAHLTETPLDHVKLAAQSPDYKLRARAQEAQAAEAEKHEPEVKALQSAIAYIENAPMAETEDLV